MGLSDARRSALSVFLVSLKLGLTCFGGPVAHLGYFHQEFVVRRKWIKEREYADLVALCQFLPGPSSSQVNMAIGMVRARWRGALAAWVGFTLPSALLMIAFAYGVEVLGDAPQAGWLKGLKLAAAAVVARAVRNMATQFCAERSTATIALMATLLLLAVSLSWMQVAVLGAGMIAGWLLYRHSEGGTAEEHSPLEVPYGFKLGVGLLAAFLILFAGLPFLKTGIGNPWVASFDAFYRAGSLVFGGGHVVLPLLQSEVVKLGWIGDDRFLAGYGAAQALPGPLFTFSAYLGAMMKTPFPRWMHGLWCLFAIYLPSFLLVFGALPFWESLRRKAAARALLKGANAAVVGILLAALYHPIWTSGIQGPKDFMVALAAFGLLTFWSVPPWIVVAFSAVAGGIFLG